MPVIFAFVVGVIVGIVGTVTVVAAMTSGCLTLLAALMDIDN